MTAKRILILSAAAILLIPVASGSAEEFITDSSVRVARHDRRPSPVKFPKVSEKTPLNAWGMVFAREWNDEVKTENPDLIQYEQLPNCKKSEVKRVQVHQVSPDNALMDIVYFSDSESEELRHAKAHRGMTVAYQAALTREPGKPAPSYLQTYARFMQIECLPTRLRYREIDGQFYHERLTGQAAWDGSEKTEKN